MSDPTKEAFDRLLEVAMTDGLDDSFLFIHQTDMRFVYTHGLHCFEPCIDRNLIRYGYVGTLCRYNNPMPYRSLYIHGDVEPGTALVVPCTQPNVDLTRPNAVSYLPMLLEQCHVRRVHRLYQAVPARDPITVWDKLIHD